MIAFKGVLGRKHPRNPGKLDRVVKEPFTAALLHFNAGDNTTQFVDETGKIWIPVNTARHSTAQFKFGGSAGLFNAGVDYIYSFAYEDFVFGLGDFSIECWVRFGGAFTANALLFDFRPGLGSVQGLYSTLFYQNASTKFVYYVNSLPRITGTTTPGLGVWYHVAVARSGTNTKMFINGVQEGSTYTDSNDYLVGSMGPVIGNGSNAYIDEVRISKGIARWTANFTPPVAEY